MLSPDMRTKLVTASLLLSPILLVKLAGLTVDDVDAKPAATPAPAVNAAPTAIQLPQRKLSEDEQKVVAYVAQLQSQSFGRTPLHHDTPAAEPPPVVGETAESFSPDQSLRATVRGIMSSRGESVAIVNDRPMRVGDMLNEDLWTIIEIDINQRIVVFQHVDTNEQQIRKVLGP